MAHRHQTKNLKHIFKGTGFFFFGGDQVSRAWCLGGPNESYQLAKTEFNDSQQGIKNRNRGRNPALTTAQPLQLLCQICTESLEKKHLSDCR